MTDPRYPGWDHPTTEPVQFDNRVSRPDGVPGPALVLALVVGVVVLIVGGLWWVGR